MIYLFSTLTRYIMQCSLFTFFSFVAVQKEKSALGSALGVNKESLSSKTKLFEENK